MTENKQPHRQGDQRLVAVLIRGRIGLHRDVKRTLDLLGLKKKHACVILKDDASTRGMLRKAKDAITWGAIADETYRELAKRRGAGEEQQAFALHPPRGGFERKGIKKPFSTGGALGDRKERMDELIKRMT
ncbi:uL30 family ribosomal protein [Candidatus Woesearchaeota archaeon]|nr:uL30 family ribosomal protein [Candidatus Woesearchaeota archaeon]